MSIYIGASPSKYNYTELEYYVKPNPSCNYPYIIPNNYLSPTSAVVSPYFLDPEDKTTLYFWSNDSLSLGFYIIYAS